MTSTPKPDIFDTLAYECGKQIHKHTIQILVKGGEYRYNLMAQEHSFLLETNA